MKFTKFEKDLVLFALEDLAKRVLTEKLDIYYMLTLNDEEEIDEYTQYEKIKEIIKKLEENL